MVLLTLFADDDEEVDRLRKRNAKLEKRRAEEEEKKRKEEERKREVWESCAACLLT